MDKAELIRHEIEKRRDHNLAIGNPLFAAMAEEDIELLSFIDSLQEQPVSEDLEEEFNHFHENHRHTFRNLELLEWGLDIARHFANWQKQKDKETIELAEDHAMLAGMVKMKEQMMKNIWKPADGDDLPEIDKEVIVLTQNYPLENSEYAVSFAHRPYKGKYIGKSLTTGNIETFENKTYDKGGWNQPNVKWWLDCEWPNKEATGALRKKDMEK